MNYRGRTNSYLSESTKEEASIIGIEQDVLFRSLAEGKFDETGSIKLQMWSNSFLSRIEALVA